MTTRPATSAYAAPWGARGFVTDLDGPVHWIEFSQDNTDTPENNTPILFVHGLGGSHLNWCLIGPRLAAGRRAFALDLHGFGLTPGLRANSTVQANARLVDRFITEVIGAPVILVGNSMGGLISILETAEHPENVKGVVLIDPALPLPAQKPDWPVSAQFLVYALPGLGEAAVARLLYRTPPESAVRQVLELCFADPSRADPEMIKAEIAIATRRHPVSPTQSSVKARIFLAAARSLLRVLARRGKYQRMMAGIDVPVLFIGGEADRLVPVAAMRHAAARNPHWESLFLDAVGHVPMLEVPDTVTAAIRDWLARSEESTNHAATDRT